MGNPGTAGRVNSLVNCVYRMVIMVGETTARQPKKFYYEDQGGWDCYTWGRVARHCFVLKDTVEFDGSSAAGN